MPMFESTAERHDYYRGRILEVLQKHSALMSDVTLKDLTVLVDGLITASRRNRVPPNETAIPIPEHFIPNGARCTSCGYNIDETMIDEDRSDSIKTFTACINCGNKSIYYMSEAMATLIKGKEE